MEQLDYTLLYCWFVGLDPDEPVWVSTVFTKNRDQLLDAEIASGVSKSRIRAQRAMLRLLGQPGSRQLVLEGCRVNG